MPEEPLWAIPDGKSDVQPSPVQAGLNSSIVSRTLAGGPPSVSFGGIARLVGLKAQLWDSAALTPVCGKGSMWLSSRVRVRDGFDVCAEVCSLAEGAHITLTLRACSRWALSPLDGPPVPLFAPSPSSSLPPPVAMPPQTLSIQIAHLKIDRGVFDIRVHARGFLGLGACLGAYPSPCPAAVSAVMSCILSRFPYDAARVVDIR